MFQGIGMAVIVLTALIGIVGTVGLLITQRQPGNAPERSRFYPLPQASKQVHSEMPPDSANQSLIDQLPVWAPDIEWEDPKRVMGVVQGEPVSGLSRLGRGTSSVSLVPDVHPGIYKELMELGWQAAYLADAPGGSSYGYTKTEEGRRREARLEYQTRTPAINASGPIQFAECPCAYELMVFYSDPF